MIILSHPTGNANVKAAASGFKKAEILLEFWTAIASFPGGMLDYLSAFEPFSEFRRRSFDLSLRKYTRTWPWTEAGRLTASKLGIEKLTRHESGLFSIDAVYKNFDRHVAKSLKNSFKKGARAIYAYEDGAEYSFKEAKQLGIKCYYDLPIGYWRTARQILKLECERWPEWIATITSFHDSEEKLKRKDEELHHADKIFVASSFTAKTLKDFSGILAPIHIVPYGFPPVCLNRHYTNTSNNRIKLLFVGGLSQRKGVADLFAAVKPLANYIELTVVGRKVNNECKALNTELNNYTWIPSLPHDKILTLMKHHDVLIFPSHFEGFGLVITEAMSQGLPVITTERTAGPDLIEHEKSGWIVKAGAYNSIKMIIEDLLTYPKKIIEIGNKAKEIANRRPWTVYAHELASAITMKQ